MRIIDADGHVLEKNIPWAICLKNLTARARQGPSRITADIVL